VQKLVVLLYVPEILFFPSGSLAVVAAACTSHPTLREISFQYNDLEHAPGRAAIEALLDALQASIPGLRLTR